MKVGFIGLSLIVLLLSRNAVWALSPPASNPPSRPLPQTTAALAAGKTQFNFVDEQGDPTRPVTVWMFVPEACSGVNSTCPLQVVMHGVQRNGETYLDSWVEFAKDKKFIVIAPEFSRQYFPRDDDYSLGRSTTEPDAKKWAFAVPDHLFDELKLRYGLSAASYRLFGHSAGGQFVHRLQLFYPEHRASPVIAANPGWYTEFEWGMADAVNTKFKFPYNTIGSRVDEARAKTALRRPFVLMLGDRDTDANDTSLNKSAGANSQGLFRFARGQHFLTNAKAAAQKLGVVWNWQSITVAGVAHDQAAMAKAAIAFMYPSTPPTSDKKLEKQ